MILFEGEGLVTSRSTASWFVMSLYAASPRMGASWAPASGLTRHQLCLSIVLRNIHAELAQMACQVAPLRSATRKDVSRGAGAHHMSDK